MDIRILNSERVIHRDESGLYQTKEFSYELVKKDVPEQDVRKVTHELRLQVKKFLLNTLILERLRTPDEAITELNLYKADLEKFEAKNV